MNDMPTPDAHCVNSVKQAALLREIADLRAQLALASAKVAEGEADRERLKYALDQIGFMLAGTQFDGASRTILRVLRGESLKDIRCSAARTQETTQ